MEGRSMEPISPAPPPAPLLGWYDLPDYKTALPCVCLFSVPAERPRARAPAAAKRRRGEREREGDAEQKGAREQRRRGTKSRGRWSDGVRVRSREMEE